MTSRSYGNLQTVTAIWNQSIIKKLKRPATDAMKVQDLRSHTLFATAPLAWAFFKSCAPKLLVMGRLIPSFRLSQRRRRDSELEWNRGTAQQGFLLLTSPGPGDEPNCQYLQARAGSLLQGGRRRRPSALPLELQHLTIAKEKQD